MEFKGEKKGEEEEKGKKSPLLWVDNTGWGEGGLDASQKKQRGDGVLAAGQSWQAAFMN